LARRALRNIFKTSYSVEITLTQTEMGFVDTEMISYLILSTSLFVVSPALLQDEQRQRQLETKFNNILAKNDVKDVNEIIQRALLRYFILKTELSCPQQL
jgi:hypothetical protein